MRAKVELFVDLDAVAADAKGALDQSAQVSLYNTLDWFRLTRQHILTTTSPLVARARTDKASAWLFLADRGGGRADAFGSWYTLRFAPIFAGDADEGERIELVAALAGSLRKRLARVSLQPVDDADLGLLVRGFRSAGWLTGRAVQTVNWIAHTAGDDFEAYWAKRPGQLRNTVRRKAAKANLAVRLFDDFSAEAWADYETVFAASWKGQEGSLDFLRALAERAAQWGRMRMAIGTSTDGEPLAAQFWTVDGPVATIHKLAYVDAAKALSPGSILSHAMFAHVIDRDRPEIVDFGTGDDPYKADWMDDKRNLHRFEAYNATSLVGVADYARSRLGALVRRIRRS